LGRSYPNIEGSLTCIYSGLIGSDTFGSECKQSELILTTSDMMNKQFFGFRTFEMKTSLVL
jgi:hypothetical protein